MRVRCGLCRPNDIVLYGLSLVAIAAQAMTAALAAGRRSMDWVGVCMLGSITALGGGTIRDVLLGHYPLLWVENPIYLGLTGVAAFVTILIARVVHRLNLAFLVLDAIGLVVFTMAGCDVAWQMNESLPIVIVSGMITGCAGGVLRDILCNDVPLLFRAELYASVSVVTGLFYATAFGLETERRDLDGADLCPRPVVAVAGDPLQMGNAEIRVQRGRRQQIGKSRPRSALFAGALHLLCRHRRCGVAPGVADIGRDIGDLLIRQSLA